MIGEYYNEEYESECYDFEFETEDDLFLEEFDDEYDDGFVNAKEFRILRGIFCNDLERLEFNSISNHVRDQIIQVAN